MNKTLMLPSLGLAALVLINHDAAAGPTTVDLSSAANFAVLAGGGITVAGPVASTKITGDIGTYATTSITGFENVVLVGVNHAGDSITQQGKTDLFTAYNDAAARAPTVTYNPIQDLGGLTLGSGVYHEPTSLAITGSLTLDGGGDPNAVFIFQAGSTLTAESGSQIILTDGAQASNVFWQVGSSATLDTGADFIGNILALSAITADTDAKIQGRLLALDDSVTLDNNTIILPLDVGTATSSVPAVANTLVLFCFSLGTLIVFGRRFQNFHPGSGLNLCYVHRN
jgi:Ice-binding-like